MEPKALKIFEVDIRLGFSEPFRRTPLAEVTFLDKLTVFCDLVGGTGVRLRHKGESWGAVFCHNCEAIGLNLYHFRNPNTNKNGMPDTRFFGIHPRR